MERRKLLKAGVAAGIASLLLSPEFKLGEENKILAFGAYLVPGPNGEEIGKWARIIGTKGYKYLVDTDKGIKEVPLEHLKLLEGWPFPYVSLPYLGIRNDAHWVMEWVPRFGASMVRINLPVEVIGTNSEVEICMRNAKGFGLRPLVVFNPMRLLPEGHLRERVRTFFWLYPEAVIELGNEPDNPEWEMWKDGDLNTFARFVGIAYDEAVKSGHGGEVVLGALVDVYKQKKLFEALRGAGVDPNWFLGIGLHVYQSVAAVKLRMAAMKKAMKQAGVSLDKIWITELGVNFKDKKGLMGMIDEAVGIGAAMVLVHELPVWQSPDWIWGMVDPYLEVATPMIFDFAEWSRKRAEALGVNSISG